MRVGLLAATIVALLFDVRPIESAQGACGPLTPNREGLRDGSVVTERLERRIARFADEAGLTPGLGVAVVKNGRAVLVRGFGVSDLSTCEPVAPDSRFYLKSTTKSFLGLLAALLHEEGVVELDAPITDYLPGLDLGEPLDSRQVPLRAHFTHTTPYMDGGLQYRTAHFGNLADADFVAHANRFAAPKSTKFGYSNFAPMMGARALARATGTSWRDLMETKVFAPAGMTSSFAYVSKAERAKAVTSYIAQGKGAFVPTVTKHESQMVAAGGSYSTPDDLARWLILNLERGSTEAKQVFPARVIDQVHAPQVQLDWTFYTFDRFAHGLGIYHSDYEGDRLMHHFGGETHVSFMPEHGIGIAVLTNGIGGGGSYVTHRLAATLYDELLGKEDADSRWDARLLEVEDSLARRERQLADHVASEKDKAPVAERSFRLEELAGTYSDPRLGDAVVSARDGALHVTVGVLKTTAEWVSGDGYLVNTALWGGPPDLWIFRRNDAGKLLIDWGGRIFERRD